MEESDCQSIDEKLKATSELIEKLSKLQHVRLTTEPKDKNYQNVTYPSKEETTLSQQLRSELQLLIATLHPAEVINADSLHNLMGINSEALNKTKSLEEN
ncbi:hypothetical protein A3Q56_01236 [Intoshia linei]|uniref:DUF7785 domain-containing protein n=1 Tax=Intoshia linei TaxID=1819745 RepID=A0A177B9N1_9BILA|nr:hypothetical protein A3Q56_01236 [Intoshia linei]